MTKSTRPRSRFAALRFALGLMALAACGAAPEAAAPAAPTPEADVRAAAGTITAADMATRIGILAHDSMAGRHTTSPELEQAATYIADHFRDLGLEPAGDDGTFLHRFDFTLTTLVPEETTVRAAGSDREPTYATEYFMIPPAQRVEAPVHYMGIAGEASTPPATAQGRILVYQHPGTAVDQEWQGRLMAALQAAMMAQAPGVILIASPDFSPETISQLAYATAGQQAPLAVVGMTHEAGSRLIADLGGDLDALENAGQNAPVGTGTVLIRATRSEEAHRPPTVVGLLRGSDPALRDTYVVLTAHFDHEGIGQPDETGDSIYNGADDDASGTAAVMEVAEAFVALDRAPARSVVFLLVSGEEQGLLGSSAWVENPTVDIGQVIANVNLDMVGRNAPDTVIGIGQEYTTLQDVLDDVTAANPDLGLNVILDPRPEEMYFFRSDQLPFIQRGIPAVFFTTGDHEDYHRPSDEPDKIDNDKAARIARLAFHLAHAIANSAEAPDWTEEGQARVREMLGM